MKAIYKNIALAALALSAVACTQEEDFAPSFLNDPDAVRITAQVASGNVTGGFTRSNPLGNDDDDEQQAFNNGDAIAVIAGNQAAVIYTFDGTDTWTPEEGKYLKWEADEMNFTAWYPVGEGTDAQNFTPNYGQTASLEELQTNDYMTFSENIQKNGNDNSASIELERQMVRIVISQINYGNQYDATTNAVESIAITAGSSKYTNGVWDNTNVTAQMYKHTDGDWYAVLPPTATAEPGQTFLTITLATHEILFVKGIPATAAGKSYDYTLTVGKDKATIGNVSVADWGTSQEITGGVAEEVPTYCYLPEGTIFRDAVKEFLSSNTNLTQIKFIADPSWNPEGSTQIEESGAYMVANGTTLEIRTDAEVFMFNEISSSMFRGTINNIGSRITSIDFNGCINTSNVTNLDWMFQNCSKLTSLDLTGFNTANVTSLHSMFAGCGALQNITFGNSFSTNKVTAMDYVFQSCSNLTSLDLTGFSFNDNPTTKEMFYYTGGNNPTENRIPIKVTETGYNFLKDKTDTKILYSNAKYVKPDGVTPWETSTP